MNNITDAINVKRYLHPTKGWKRGEWRSRKMPVAIQYRDGSVEVDTKNKKQARITGGMFIIRKKKRAA